MKILSRLLIASWLAASGVLAVRAEEVAYPSQPPVVSTTVTTACFPGGASDCTHCRPECNIYSLYVMERIKFPFEVYARVGPSFVTSGSELDDVLHQGVAAQFGARCFCYDCDKGGAWTADFGIDYIFNNADSNAPIIIVDRIADAERSFFGSTQTVPVLVRETFGISELHRAYVRVAGGREWYWSTDEPNCIRYYLAVDAGVRLGHAHAALHELRREFIEGFNPRTDRFIKSGDNNVTDFIKNGLVSTTLGVIIPYCGYDVLLGIRVEYSHDLIRLPFIQEQDNGLDQVMVLLNGGLRW